MRTAAAISGACVAAVLVVAGCGSASHPSAAPSSSATTSTRSPTTTTPLTVPPTTRPKPITHGDQDLFALPAMKAFLAGRAGNVTAAVFDQATGRMSVYHPGDAEDTASIVKVDVLATLMAQAQAAGRFITAGQQALAVPMIEQSDNDDAQDLWDGEGGARAIVAFDASVHLVNTVPAADGEFGLSTTTAADQVRLLQKVAYRNFVLSDTSRAYVLDLMTHVNPTQAWGVSAGVPAGVSVAIKNGWLPLDSGGWQVNSIGYVNGQGRDYLIAVLTNGNTSENEGISTIEGISTLAWHELAPAS